MQVEGLLIAIGYGLMVFTLPSVFAKRDISPRMEKLVYPVQVYNFIAINFKVAQLKRIILDQK